MNWLLFITFMAGAAAGIFAAALWFEAAIRAARSDTKDLAGVVRERTGELLRARDALRELRSEIESARKRNGEIPGDEWKSGQ